MDWINDHAPGTTVFDGRWEGRDGRPTVDWLAQEIAHGEDVEFFIDNDAGTFYHALTLTGIRCDAAANCAITYSDPNDPTNRYNRDLSLGAGGRLEFDDPFGLNGTVFIDAAFSESAVAGPATLFLLATAFGGVLVLRVRRRRV
jgi:hypothetical protein